MLFIKLTSLSLSMNIYVIKKGPYLDVFDILFIITYRLLKNILSARQLQLQYSVSYSCKLNKLWSCGSTMFYSFSENENSENENRQLRNSIAKRVIYWTLQSMVMQAFCLYKHTIWTSNHYSTCASSWTLEFLSKNNTTNLKQKSLVITKASLLSSNLSL